MLSPWPFAYPICKSVFLSAPSIQLRLVSQMFVAGVKLNIAQSHSSSASPEQNTYSQQKDKIFQYKTKEKENELKTETYWLAHLQYNVPTKNFFNFLKNYLCFKLPKIFAFTTTNNIVLEKKDNSGEFQNIYVLSKIRYFINYSDLNELHFSAPPLKNFTKKMSWQNSTKKTLLTRTTIMCNRLSSQCYPEQNNLTFFYTSLKPFPPTHKFQFISPPL